MTELDDVMVPAALELIDELGKLLTFTPPTGTYIPGGGEKTGEAPAPFARKAAPPTAYEKSLATGAFIQEGNTLTFVAASGLTQLPALGWKVDVDGETWTATRVTAIYSGEDIALYEVELER